MWFCYECNAEMRPLMMPDPHCASCNGTFVEQIESDQDDPRNFQAGPLHGDADDAFGLPFGFINTGPGSTGPGSRSPPPNVPTNPLEMFQSLMMGLGGPQRPQRQSSTSSTSSSNTAPPNGNANTFRIDRRSDNGNGGAPTFSFGPTTSSRPGIMRGGSDIPYGAGSPPPPASSSTPGGAARTGSFPGGGFVLYSGSSGGGGPTHPGEGADLSPLLSALFGGPMSPNGDGGAARGGAHGPPNPLQNLLMGLFGGGAAGGGAHDGQFGDYAVTQEALDRIITQLMEQGNGDKPVPAPDDMIAKLPRAKVSEGSELLEKDCAVCKDDFEIAQDTIQLPCKHVFHDECILPWIKQSGTCPVCRFELVPQPKHAPTATGPGGGGPSTGSGSGSGNAGGSSGGGGGLGGGLFSMFSRGGNNSNANANSNSSSSTSQSSSSSPPGQGGLPGGWHDHDLD